MRTVLTFLLVFGGLAQAAEMECEFATGKNKYATAKMDFYPMLLVDFGSKTCFGKSSKFCMERTEQNVITPDRVCGYRVDQRWDCRTQEWNDGRGNHVVETRCPRWDIAAEVLIDRRGEGTLSCYNRNRLERSWRLGTCGWGR